MSMCRADGGDAQVKWFRRTLGRRFAGSDDAQGAAWQYDDPLSQPTKQSQDGRTYEIDRAQIRLRPCPELAALTTPRDHKVAAAALLGLSVCGYELSSLVIGGGSTELSHNGAVEYAGSYRSLKEYLEESSRRYHEADEEALASYGGWYSGLVWSWIRFDCQREGARVTGEITSSCSVTLTWTCEHWDGHEEELASVRSYLCSDQLGADI